MTMLEKMAGAFRGPAPATTGRPDIYKAERVKPMLDEAEHTLAALEAEHGPLALSAFLKEHGADEALAAWHDRHQAQRATVDSLRAAHAAALEVDALAQRRAVASIRKSQMHAVSQHLAARDKAALALAVALENATDAYRDLVKRSGQARAANPAGGEWPSGTMCEPNALRDLVAAEIYRAMGAPKADGQCPFPGGRVANPMLYQDPKAIPPLLDTLKAATAGTLDIIYGRAAE